MPNITIRRTDQYANKLAKIDVCIDAKRAFMIANNETKSIEVAEGEHTLYAKIDWCKTAPISLSLQEGMDKEFELGTPVFKKPGSYSLMIGFLAALALPIGFIYNFTGNKIFLLFPLFVLLAYMITKFILFKEKPLLYYVTIGSKEYIYLKEIG